MAAKKSFLLRLSPEIWQELERWAGDDFRSVNGQIEFLLHEAVNRRRRKAPASAGKEADASRVDEPASGGES